MLNRRLAIVLALSLGLAASAPALAQDKSIVVASTTSTQDFRPVRSPSAAVQGKKRHRREGDRAGHRSGARHRAPRRCRRGAGACEAAGRKVRRRRFRREALRSHVQRFRADRTERAIPPASRDRTTSSPRCRRSSQEGCAVRLARRQIGHACGRACALEAGRHRDRDGKRAVVSRDRAGHGRGAQHGGREQCLCPLRPRHLAVVQESRRSRHRGRRRPAPVQSIRRHPRQSGKTSDGEEGTRPGLHRLAAVG